MENVIKFYKDTYGEEPPKKFAEMDSTFLLGFANAYQKQCIINGVGSSLPNRNTVISEIKKNLKEINVDKKVTNIDFDLGYSLGFFDGFDF